MEDVFKFKLITLAEEAEKKELLKKFQKAIEKEKESLNYLKEAASIVENNNHGLHGMFLKDALIKLERIKIERLSLQEELIEEKEGVTEI